MLNMLKHIPGKTVKSKQKPKIPTTKETPFQCLQELDDAPPIYREPTEYYNSPEKIAEIDRIKISELLLYVQGMSEDSFGSEFQVMNMPHLNVSNKNNFCRCVQSRFKT